jgi:peptidoglycan/LPS O-acetylase OafA/YrhL
MATDVNAPKRAPADAGYFNNVDLLRGLAALLVLLWHYQHFHFVSGDQPGDTTSSMLPYHDDFPWLFSNGSLAVYFFWALSGFVFFASYQARPQISLREYFVGRLSRLYPLHFITLIAVAFIQLVSFRLLHKYEIYANNDLKHFILQLFMASFWGLQNGHSFNGPIWSVSVEILVYVMFFAFLKTSRIGVVSAVAFLAWNWLFFKQGGGYAPFQCALLFSIGGLVYVAHSTLARKNPFWSLGAAVLVALVVWRKVPDDVGLEWFAFPSLLWLAAALDGVGWSSGAVGRAVGSITYSSYLLHVPLQLIILIILDGFIGSRAIVDTHGFFIFFMATVLGLSWVVARYVEVPLRDRLRKQLSGPRSPTPA